MSLLNSILGGLTGGAGGNPQMQNVLGQLLAGAAGQGGAQQAPQGSAPASDPAAAAGGLGGLGALISAFQQAGLGDVMQSWVNQGPNQPVTPDQLQNVLGDKAQSMAQGAGLPLNDFLSQLSQHLPKAVDQLTPNGRLPDGGTVSA